MSDLETIQRNDLPSGWRVVELSDVVVIKYGKDHKKLKIGKVPCYGTGGIMRYVEKEIYNKESILLPRKGSLNNIYYVNEPFWTVDTLFWSQINNEKVIAKYLFYNLSQKKLHLLNVGSAVPSLTVPLLNRLKINLPPLPEQKAIANILGKLDDKIELNRQINQTLETMAQTLFKSWFVDFDPVIDNALKAGNPIPDSLKPQANKRKTIKSTLPQATQNLFPNCFVFNDILKKWIPEGWLASNIGKEFDVVMGQSPLSSTYNDNYIGTPFFQGKTDFGFRFPKKRIYCTKPKRMAKKGDVLISVRAPVGNVNMALFDCAIGRGLCAVKHKSNSISYSCYVIQNLKNIFDSFEGEGTIFGSINQNDLKNIGIVKPPLELVEKFDKKINKNDKQNEKLYNQIQTLTKLRDTLLPKLISGKIRVPNNFII